MYGDFSRVLDGSSGRYSAVLAQQGRLLLDADLNEQTAILLDYVRRLTTDLIGPFAGPIQHAGFDVDLVVDDGKLQGVRLSSGHYYVYGLRCEAPERADIVFALAELEPPFVVYLAVWERTVSAMQAPGLADPALGPAVPDTSLRTQVCWQPLAGPHLPGKKEGLTELEPQSIIAAFHAHNTDAPTRPALGARTHSSSEAEPDVARAPTATGYRGVENQLYRVEVHRGGNAEDATFKWSRDNGSVEVAIDDLSAIEGEGLRIAALRGAWYDARRGLEVGDWVELVDDDWAPLGTPSPLMQVQGVSLAQRSVTLQDSDFERVFDARRHPILRRWDQRPGGDAPNHGISVTAASGRWFELEDGVQVQFQEGNALYTSGDFWLIPARAAIGGVLWPTSHDEPSAPLALPPKGPARYLAPLALVKKLSEDRQDLRVRFGRVAGDHVEDHVEPPPELTTDATSEVATSPPATAIRPPAVTYRVRSVSDVSPGSVFAIADGTTIGRADDAGIHFDHPDISRHHAQFGVQGDVLTIMDLGSTNGTKVNGQQLAERVSVQLAPGDTIQVGSRELQLQVEEA
ncbi:MAG: DUF6519 domain-containing protein [Solirubrobacteraceae bacterium]